MAENEQHASENTVVMNDFVRERNVLFSYADFSPLFVDYYLHLSEYQLRPTPEVDTLFKSALAAFTLHAASKPRNYHLSWTISLQEIPLNLFLVADSARGAVTGRVFTDNIKQEEYNSFYQDLIVPGKPSHRSFVDFKGGSPLVGAERFYRQSEQRPGKFFHIGGDQFGLVTAHPDYDENWFEALTLDDVIGFPKNEVLSNIEKREFGWHCGCSVERILKVISPQVKDSLDELFGDSSEIEVNCPRCAARYSLTKGDIRKYLEAQ